MAGDSEKLYQIALTLLPGVGDVTARRLLRQFGPASAVFSECFKKGALPALQLSLKKKASLKDILDRAASELEFCERNNIDPVFLTDSAYPYRLREVEDSPVLLYVKGNADLNPKRSLAIVGSRSATPYGKGLTERMVSDLRGAGVTIVSGLAYGIDIVAHQAALDAGLPTIGVPGHGLDRIYPAEHSGIAQRMLGQGGLVTEFPSQTIPDRENFPKRNRVIAALVDAVLVAEAGEKGGALITARLAFGYHREVLAFPGKIGDPFSKGCNKLIKTNVAALVESAEDLLNQLNWEVNKEPAGQRALFSSLTEEEKKIIELLYDRGQIPLDDLSFQAAMPVEKTSAILLNLEFSGLVRMLPGKLYRLTP